MPQLELDFTTVDPDSKAPAPPGTYNCEITKTLIKENSRKNGHYVQVQFRVLDGTQKGKTLFNNYNIVHHTSPDAERIGRSQLKSLAIAAGCPQFSNNTDVLHGRCVGLTLEMDGTYNNVTAVFPIDQAPTTVEPGMPGETPAAKAPWDPQ